MPKNYLFFILFVCYGVFAQQTETFDANSRQQLIENEKLANAVSLYPNPVGEILKVRSQEMVITKVEIFSILGAKVKDVNTNYKSIYLGNLSRGIYLIKVYSEKGYTVKKLIKK